MAVFTFFDEAKKRLGDADIDLTTSTGHVFKLFLTNTTPNVDTHASDALIGYWDNVSTVSLTDTNTFTLNLDANFEIFTLDG